MTQTRAEKDSLVAKLCGDDGDGPVVLSEGERELLQSWFLGINQRNVRLTRRLSAWAEALSYNGIRITHTKRDDGSEGFDLEAAPNTENATVN